MSDVRYVASLYDALYRSLGEAAPRAQVDSVAVRLHEASRALGAVVLKYRTPPEIVPHSLVLALMNRTIEEDPAGIFTLFALTMVIGPRILVTLRDAQETQIDQEIREKWSGDSQVLLQVMHDCATTAGALERIDDPTWAVVARAMEVELEGAGYADQLGPLRE